MTEANANGFATADCAAGARLIFCPFLVLSVISLRLSQNHYGLGRLRARRGAAKAITGRARKLRRQLRWPPPQGLSARAACGAQGARAPVLETQAPSCTMTGEWQERERREFAARAGLSSGGSSAPG